MSASGPVVILGAGHAGGRVAQSLREGGFDGPIHLVGAEPHPPYQRPPLSKELLQGRMEPAETYLEPAEFWPENRIDLLTDSVAVTVDRQAKKVGLADGRSLPYGKLVIATGGRPRRLAMADEVGAPDRVHYLRDIGDALRLKQVLTEGMRLAIIGGGVIGLEVAASARKLGCAVTVMEMGPVPLGRMVAPEIGEWFTALHRGNGVDLHFGQTATAIEATPTGLVLTLTGGARLEADHLAIGIGIIPNVDMLRDHGVDIDDGILVDGTGKSADPDLYATGDVARGWHASLDRHARLETWRIAERQSRTVGAAIAGQPVDYDEVPWVWSDQYDVNLQMVGAPLHWDDLVWRGDKEAGKFSLLYLKEGVLVGGTMVNNGREMRPLQQLIGRRAKIAREVLGDSSVALLKIAKELAAG